MSSYPLPLQRTLWFVVQEWEGGRRPGIRWLRLFVLFAAVCAAALWSLQRDSGLTVERDVETVEPPVVRPDVVVMPPRKAGDRWYCPSEAPVRAYAAGAIYYPPHYPGGAARLSRPDECYVDEQWAQEAGYRLADPPPDTVVAGGVYVMDAGSSALNLKTCTAVAVEAGIAVPCPTRLPSPATGPSCADDRCRLHDGVVIEQRAFDAPPDFCVGCDPTTRHVMITAIEGDEPRHFVTCPRSPARGEDGGSVTPIPDDIAGLWTVGRTPQILRCGAGPPWVPGIGGVAHEGHTMARWRTDQFMFAVGVDGHGAAQTALLDAVLDGIQICAPHERNPRPCVPLRG